MKPNEASRIVIGAAIRVHTALGAGILESAYDACLLHELTRAGLHVEHKSRFLWFTTVFSWRRRIASISSSKTV
jgi:GxxExxY protein